MSSLTNAQREELGCTFAALALHDDGVAITGDNIAALLNAANIKFQPFWPGLFAKVLAGRDLDEVIMNAGGSAGGGGGGGGGAAAGGDAGGDSGGADKEPEPEEKAESSSSSDEDMGFDLFD